MESLEKLNQEIQIYPDQASRIIIYDNKTLKSANEFLLDIKALRKKVAETFDPIIEKAYKTHKEAVAKKKEFEQPLIKAEGAIKLQIASYMEEQRKIREEAERKAREEEEERLRIQIKTEKEAKRLENAGYTQEAEETRRNIPGPKSAILPEIPILNKTQVKKVLKWEVVDFEKIPRQFLQIDSAKVTAHVRAYKDKVNIPGIRVFYESSVATRVFIGKEERV